MIYEQYHTYKHIFPQFVNKMRHFVFRHTTHPMVKNYIFPFCFPSECGAAMVLCGLFTLYMRSIYIKLKCHMRNKGEKIQYIVYTM